METKPKGIISWVLGKDRANQKLNELFEDLHITTYATNL